MTSSDGFCSILTFSSGELGQIYTNEVPTYKNPIMASTAISSSQNTPIPTPTSTIPPKSPFPSSNNHQRTPSNQSIAPSPPASLNPTIRPSSPTRSNSTSSIATQASYAHLAPGSVVNNPPLVSGNLPSVMAGSTGLGFVTGIPMTTPPQTPRSTTSSMSGIKREASESEKEDGGRERKKRRVAPTLVSGEQSTSGS